MSPQADNFLYKFFLPVIVTILVPIILALGAVRLVLNPWFVEFEYRTPGFPADPYGFSMQDRLHYSRIALDYLLNNAGISFLGDLHFPAGQQAPDFSCAQMTDCTRFYNDRELKHMGDVKNVLHIALQVWYISLGAMLILGIWAWQGRWLDEFRRGLSIGGWLTVGLILLVFFFVVFAFDTFFVFFHNLFFTAGTWLFYTSDSLIRLFPERFWQDTFLIVGGLAVIVGLGIGFFVRSRK
jgi:integral membrane protein (TIGR01906 family)